MLSAGPYWPPLVGIVVLWLELGVRATLQIRGDGDSKESGESIKTKQGSKS